MAISPFEHRIYPCPHCHIGNLHPSPAFFCAWHEGQFISAPDFPAWVCDVCGGREYDQQAVLELDAILQVNRRRRRSRRGGYQSNRSRPLTGHNLSGRRG